MPTITCPRCFRKIFGEGQSCPGCQLPRGEIRFCGACGASVLDKAITCTECGGDRGDGWAWAPRGAPVRFGASAPPEAAEGDGGDKGAFPVLRVLASAYKVLGQVTAILALACAAVLLASVGDNEINALFSAVLLVLGGVIVVTMYALAEGILLLLALEQNTRGTLELMREKAGASPPPAGRE